MGTSPPSRFALLRKRYATITTNIHLILEREHLDSLIPLFEKQGVTNEIINTITDEDLKTLGVENSVSVAGFFWPSARAREVHSI